MNFFKVKPYVCLGDILQGDILQGDILQGDILQGDRRIQTISLTVQV